MLPHRRLCQAPSQSGRREPVPVHSGMLRLALAMAVLGTGCSTTIGVERPFANERLAEINSVLAGRNATVTYAAPGGEPAKDVASGIALTPAKARWTVWESDFARERRTPPGQLV